MADRPVTKENYMPFIVKRFEERKNLQNSALTPLDFASDDVTNSDDVEEPAAKRPREANLEENLESIKSKDHIPCDPNVYEPPGIRSRTDSDPVQFEAVRNVFDIYATMLTNLFAYSPSDVMKLQDIPDILETDIEKRFIDVSMQKLIDDSDIIKDWANLVHFGTIYLNSLDENDLKSLLNLTPIQRGIEVGTDKELDAKDVLAAFRGNGKFDKNPDSPEFQFRFKFYRELGDGRVLVYSVELYSIIIIFQLEEEQTPLLFC
ncbi:Protein CBG22576 [Caenorhabditis briggsae]|uniref:Protein CBG22576 n=1 Tax=Caenorhabditis briggsae TaxID=6238 RepID=A8Y2M4_CAEBR|nr:Protein CBG22576 [Caenorhabditis briggsae]CAP39148.2 Protein CBG22576 [Caenorhabditis briggsae]